MEMSRLFREFTMEKVNLKILWIIMFYIGTTDLTLLPPPSHTHIGGGG